MVTIQELIRYFEEKQRQKNLQVSRINQNVGELPEYPQIVVYLGDEAAKAHRSVSTNLLQIWPQFQRELRFIGVRKTPELTYEQFRCDADEGEPLSEDDVRSLATSLFDPDMHFHNFHNLVVYYILDTSAIENEEEFKGWISAIGQVRGLLSKGQDLVEMLTVLLDESPMNKHNASGQIKNYLSGFYQEGHELRKAAKTILLLSNRREDNALEQNWEACYQIISTTIALSNSRGRNADYIFNSGSVLTAAYVREEKPFAQIGQVVVTYLLRKLHENRAARGVGDLMNSQNLRERLGLSREGTFQLLDEYVEERLCTQLPTEDQLELFPRRDTMMQGDMAAMSAREFDEYTMGAWTQYLSVIVGRAQEMVARSTTEQMGWHEAYQQMLEETFSVDEMIYLAEHADDISTRLYRTDETPNDGQVLNAAKSQLKRMLSRDEGIRKVFLEALKEQGEEAKAFNAAWSDLLESQRQLFAVTDQNMIRFYRRKVEEYFNRTPTIDSTFAKLHTPAELEEFLKDTLGRIIEGDEIFSASFEVELERRLSEGNLPDDIRANVCNRLDGGNVRVYFRPDGGDLGMPLLSAVLLKTETDLHSNLRQNLPEDTYYYNKGYSSAVEALKLYRVVDYNLPGRGV